jgi:large-conductance mechanosensitive channel
MDSIEQISYLLFLRLLTEKDNVLASLDKKYVCIFSGKWAKYAWGNFVTVLINFLLLALIIFWMVKAINRVRASVEAPKVEAPTEPPEDVLLLREIRDALKPK